MKPIIQAALDVESIHDAIELAEVVIRAGVDWLEAGTPLIISEGTHAVSELKKRFPLIPLVADIKSMDGGYIEAEMMAKAGADMVVVMGVAHPSTVRAMVRAKQKYNIKIMADLIAAPDKVACARAMEELGVDYIVIHTGFDERSENPNASPLEDLISIANVVSLPIQVTGGLSIEQTINTINLGASLVFIGAPLISVDNLCGSKKEELEKSVRDVVNRIKTINHP